MSSEVSGLFKLGFSLFFIFAVIEFKDVLLFILCAQIFCLCVFKCITCMQCLQSLK